MRKSCLDAKPARCVIYAVCSLGNFTASNYLSNLLVNYFPLFRSRLRHRFALICFDRRNASIALNSLCDLPTFDFNFNVALPLPLALPPETGSLRGSESMRSEFIVGNGTLLPIETRYDSIQKTKRAQIKRQEKLHLKESTEKWRARETETQLFTRFLSLALVFIYYLLRVCLRSFSIYLK